MLANLTFVCACRYFSLILFSCFFLIGCQQLISKPQIEEIRKEKLILAQTKGRAWRDNGRLHIHPKNGSKVTYIDEYQCDQDEAHPLDFAHCIRHRLIDYFPDRQAYIVQYILYEGDGFIWVDEITGKEQLFSNYPLFSPSGHKVVEIGDPFDNVGFAIYSFLDRSFKQEWVSDDTDSFELLSLLRWVNDDNICVKSSSDQFFRKLGPSYTSGETEPYEETFIHFYRRDDKWEVAPYWLSRAYCLVH